MITVERINRFEYLTPIKPFWGELLGKSDVDVIFLTPEWLEAWWNVYGESRELYFLVVKENGIPIGMAPLMLNRAGRSNRVIEFIGTPNIDYADVIGEDKSLILKHIMVYLDEHRNDWTRITLTQIPERSSSLAYFRDPTRKSERLLIVREIESCSQFIYDGPESARQSYEFKKSHTIKTALNVVQRTRGILVERLQGTDACREALLQLFQLHINRWEMTPTPSKFHDEKNRRFYTELIERLDPANLCFIFIWSGNVPIACSLNFEYKGTINFYTLAINLYFKKRSPGQILFIVQGEKLVKQGFMLDYSRGAHEYKHLFANRHALNYQVTIFARRTEHARTKLIDNIKRTRLIAGILKSERFITVKTKISREMEKNGLKGVVVRFFGKLGELFKTFVVNYREFYIFQYGDLPREPVKPKLPVEVKKLTVADLDKIATFYGAWEGSPKHRTILLRFEKKADCYAAFYRDNIISICWGLYHPDHHGELGLTVTPNGDEVLYTDGVTSPIYRGMKIFPYIISMMMEDYKRMGLKSIGCIASINAASLNAFSVFGLKRLRTIRYLKILGKRII